MTNNDLLYTTLTKDRLTRAPLQNVQNEGKPRGSGKVNSSCSTCGTRCVTLTQ